MIKKMIAAITILIFGFIATPVYALTVFIDLNGDMLYDSQDTFTPGDIFTAGVYADVDNAHGGLVGFGVSMNYDEPPISVNGIPTQLANVLIDPQWNFLPAKSVAPGALTAGGSLLLSTGLIGTSVHLFDVTFQATATGISTLLMTDEIPNFGDFAGQDGFDYDASGELNFLSTQIRIIPVPPALILFGSGLLGMISFARRR